MVFFYLFKDLQKLVGKYRQSMINLTVANESLKKRLEQQHDQIKQLQNVNSQIQDPNNIQDQLGK